MDRLNELIHNCIAFGNLSIKAENSLAITESIFFCY